MTESSEKTLSQDASAAFPAVDFSQMNALKYESVGFESNMRRIISTYGSNPERLTREDARQLTLYWPHIQRWRDLASSEGTVKAFEVFADEVNGHNVPGYYGPAHIGMREVLETKSVVGSAIFPYLNSIGNRTVRRWRFNDAAKQFEAVGTPIPY